ncbi:MAG: NERD domain-containing protein [Pseudohongiella sp.]|nr:NERD domain-containing protein [Pseudohongiella sp.]
MANALVKIYIGGPVDYASERKLLEHIVPWLHDKKIPSIVLANVQIDGRQIDCIIASNNFVAVVEAKTSRLPIRGDLNGAWGRLSPSGDWENYTNAYQQAVGAKHRVRDAMQSSKPVSDFYPDGYVVFTSAIPEGSNITEGDFKVLITTIDLFPDKLKTAGVSPWTIVDWENFARKFKLTSVSLDQAIGDPEVNATFTLLKRYTNAVESEYRPDAERWLPESEEQRDQLLNAASSSAGCFISGPSGCGKSLMSKWLATKLSADGHPVFLLAAKNFSGSWADSLRREIGLLVDDAPDHLYREVVRSDLSVFLIVDGINEFGAMAVEALRGIRALARRMGARLVITGQDAKPQEFNGLRGITVARPSLDLKQRIAGSAGGELTPVALELLRCQRQSNFDPLTAK